MSDRLAEIEAWLDVAMQKTASSETHRRLGDMCDLLEVAKAASAYVATSRHEGGPEYAYHLGEAWLALTAALANLEEPR